MMPHINCVLETALYVDNLDRAVRFYRDVLGLRVIDTSARLVAMDAGQATVLLLFRRGATANGAQTPTGWVPPHDGTGPIHIAFAIAADQMAEWERHLAEQGVTIESRIAREAGGGRLYFRDPDGHSVELATPGTWPTY